jgi:hypothetical protein
MPPLPLTLRPFSLVAVLFFLSHIPVTLFVDSQAGEKRVGTRGEKVWRACELHGSVCTHSRPRPRTHLCAPHTPDIDYLDRGGASAARMGQSSASLESRVWGVHCIWVRRRPPQIGSMHPFPPSRNRFPRSVHHSPPPRLVPGLGDARL